MTHPSPRHDLAPILAALQDPADVLERLGVVLPPGGRHRRALLVRCWAHDDRGPSMSVRTTHDGSIAFRCHGCGAGGGDALALVASVLGLSTARDFPAILRAAAALAGVELTGGARRASRRPDRDPVVDLALRIDAAADAWIRGRAPYDADLDAIEDAGLDACLPALRLLSQTDQDIRRRDRRRDRAMQTMPVERTTYRTPSP